MREAASRGFWVSSYAPYGYNRVKVQDGAKKRPTLQIVPRPILLRVHRGQQNLLFVGGRPEATSDRRRKTVLPIRWKRA